MRRYMKFHDLKDAVNSTHECVTWRGSVESRWNKYILELSKALDNAFFLKSKDGVECGWHVKTEDIKVLIENIKEELKAETSHVSIAYVYDKYNFLVKYLNIKAEEQLIQEAQSCNNEYCLYQINGACCNPNQYKETANSELDCELAVRADYDDVVKQLRDTISAEIRYMSLEELIEINKKCESFA